MVKCWMRPPPPRANFRHYRNEVVAKVMFLLVSVILSTGGLPHCMLGYTPRTKRRHPQTKSRHPGTKSRHPPGPKADIPLPPPRQTVNERPVRILLECTLVLMQLSVNFGQIIGLHPSCGNILDPPLRIDIVVLTGSASVIVHLVSAIAIDITARNRIKRWTGNILMFFTFTCLGI